MLDRFGVRALDLAQTEAALWSDNIVNGALLILLPLRHSPHVGIQLQMTRSAILGIWEDNQYACANTPEGDEDLNIEGVDAHARAAALAWLEHEVRRPAARRDYWWGPFRLVTRQHDDDPHFTDREGFLPIRPAGTRCTATPASYLD